MLPESSSNDHSHAAENSDVRTRILTIVLIYAAFGSLWILLSDKAVEWLLRDPARITLASTLKGWAFVAITSILLYGLMGRLIKRPAAPSAPGASLRPMVLPLALIIVAIAAISASGIAYTLIRHKDKQVARLQAIADLKTQQIAEWLGERYSDARFVHANRFWGALYSRWHEDGAAASGDLLRKRLRQFRKYNFFQSALVLDNHAGFLWSTLEKNVIVDTVLKQACLMAIRDNRVTQIGPYRSGTGVLHMDFIAPLPHEDGHAGAIVVLRVNPAGYLFPILQTSPAAKDSSEILLFRGDADQVLYLNELRFMPDTAARFHMPVADRKLAAAKILRRPAGMTGLVEGLDYRGVPVIAVVKGVEGTDWYLMAKLDRSDLYAEAVPDLLWIALAGLLALFVTTTSAYLFRQRQQLAASLRERKIQDERLQALLLLDTISNSSTDVIFAKDLQGRYLLFNREAARVLGTKAQEVLGKDDRQLFPPGQAALIMANDREVMSGGRCLTFQEELTTADGDISFMATKGPLHDPEGKVIGLFGISRDVSEIRRAEKERQLTVDFLRLVNESRDVNGLLRTAAKFFRQQAGCEAVGVRLGEKEGFPYREIQGFPAGTITAESALCHDEGNNPSSGVCLCRSIIQGRTDFPEPYYTRNGSFWTNSLTQMLDVTRSLNLTAHTLGRCKRAGFESMALIPLRMGDKGIGLLQMNDRREGLFSPEDMALWERLTGYLSVALAKIHAETSRRESEALLRAIIDNAASMIWFKDLKGRFLIVNRYAEHVLGKPADQIMGRTLFELFPQDLAQAWADNDGLVIAAGEAAETEETAMIEGEPRIFLSVRFPVRDPEGAIYGLGAICTDITERKKLEAEQASVQARLGQSQKMEALGTLAGGIAHDFNNILGIILGFTEIAFEDAAKSRSVRESLAEVLKASNRAKDLVQQILAFSRRGEPEKKTVRIGLIVREVLKMLRASLPATIEIRQAVDSRASVLADPTQIHQVLMNLCANAAHAMRAGGGILEIGLTDIRLKADDIPAHWDSQPGPYVQLTVKDNGEGISEGILDRIFDPFFTTKELGAGTGLGLSVVHGIVKSHGGAIEVKGSPGAGTTFVILLPAIEPVTENESPPPAHPAGGRERILVVDDEPALGHALRQMLERLGYEVDYRTSSIEALEVFKHSRRDRFFDLVITDMTMPGLTGMDLARELVKLQPGIPVLLCTGFSEKINAGQVKSLGIRRVLMKPMSMRLLAESIRDVLDQGAR